MKVVVISSKIPFKILPHTATVLRNLSYYIHLIIFLNHMAEDKRVHPLTFEGRI